MPTGIYPRTEFHKAIIFKNLRNREPWNKGMKGAYHIWPNGRIMSDETKKKISEAKKGKMSHRKGIKWSDEMKEKHSRIIKAIMNTPEMKNKISGKNSRSWKGGITPLRKKMYFSEQYKNWRKSVFERDNYTCVLCGIKSEKDKKAFLNADHINPWSKYPELRFELFNGRTLCIDCHRKTDTYGGKSHKLK